MLTGKLVGSFPPAFMIKATALSGCLILCVIGLQVGAQQSARPTSTAEAGRWVTRQEKDLLTHETLSYAETVADGNPRGRIRVTASCDQDMRLAFSFYSLGKGLTLRRTRVDPSLAHTGGQVLPLAVDPANVSKESLYCVHMRVRVGSGKVNEFISTYCDDNTHSTISFLGNTLEMTRQAMDMTGKLYQSILPFPALQQAIKNVGPGVPEFLTRTMNSTISNGLTAFGEVRMGDVLAADSMGIELPFTDGSHSVIELNLRDPGFQEYAESCKGPEGESTAPTAFHPYQDLQEASRDAQMANLIAEGDSKFNSGNYDGAIDAYGRALSLEQHDSELGRRALAASLRAQEAQKQQAESGNVRTTLSANQVANTGQVHPASNDSTPLVRGVVGAQQPASPSQAALTALSTSLQASSSSNMPDPNSPALNGESDLCKGESALRSPTSSTPIRVRFMNATDSTRIVYWVSYSGQRTPYMKLLPRTSYTQSTYAMHIWLITDSANRCVEVFAPRQNDSVMSIER